MKSWEDQPDVVEQCEVLCTISVRNGLAEVRKHTEGVYYVTLGTLFGSQTVKCTNADDVFRVLKMSESKKKPMSLPQGIELVA